jgi:FixJ family two-component response regulator
MICSERSCIATCIARADASLTMTEPQASVVIVDDDPEIREGLGSLLRSVGLEVRELASVPEFFKSGRPEGPTCLVLDVRLPGRSGLDFQRELVAANIELPIIFITAHGDIPMSVQAIKAGALEFLTKPFRHQELLDAIQVGLARDRTRLEERKLLVALEDRLKTLTHREREVMAGVLKGRLNKQIAADIGISEVTVKFHRGQVMRKMKASSALDLARIAERMSLTPEALQAS